MGPLWKQGQVRTLLVALGTRVLGGRRGAGWRGSDLDRLRSRHRSPTLRASVSEAYIWWVPATVLTLTTVLMAIGIAIVVIWSTVSPNHLPSGRSRRGTPERQPDSGSMTRTASRTLLNKGAFVVAGSGRSVAAVRG